MASKQDSQGQLISLQGLQQPENTPEENAPPTRPADLPWRTLDELAESEQFEEVVANEFPRYAPSEWEDGPSRRSFLQLAGASVGLAGLTACTRQPREKIIPYIEQPENIVPGKPQFFATSMSFAGIGIPLIAESHMGRPTKVAGNPDHPASSGAADQFAQASILDLYDPDRSREAQRDGRLMVWEDFIDQIRPAMQAQEALGGAGLRILTGPTSSPTTVDQISRLQERYPGAKWVQWNSAHRDAEMAASNKAFGRVLDTAYDLTQADVIVSLDSDFLSSGPAHLKNAAEFASRRQVVRSDGEGGHHGAGTDDHGGDEHGGGASHDAGPIDMNRLYALECVPGPTGAVADHRVGVTPTELGKFAAALASKVGVGTAAVATGNDKLDKWASEIAKDLQAHSGRCVVIPGQFVDSDVHVLAHAINAALGSVGSVVQYREPALAQPDLCVPALEGLVAEMNAGQVDVLVMIGVNPVYDAPGHLDFGAALAKVPQRIHVGLHPDETRFECNWHIPLAHYLEGWSDCRAFDGTLGLQQPLIEPLYGAKTEAEVLAALLGENADGYDLVRETWQRRAGSAGFDSTWRKVLHDGFLADSAAATVTVTADPAVVADAASAASSANEAGLTLIARPDPSIHDGRFANNGWLQEVPKPITKVSWDQAALMAPSTIEELGFDYNVKTERVMRFEVDGKSVEAPMLVNPGQAKGTVVLHMGHGRTRAGSVGNREGNGSNVQQVLSGGFAVSGVEAVDTGRVYKIAGTQEHYQIDVQSDQAYRRHLVKYGTKDEYEKDPHFVDHIGHHIPQNVSMFPDWEYPGYAWGMAINLNSCTGCNACIIACQAENNIPVVGREEIINGREMHWLRIDRYYQGSMDDPKVHHQPVACMHCERAPCELVCPVGATVHSDEGLNDMAYNRCIGTRYCSNNCPYKVRRFNFLKYNDTTTPVLKLARNPDVSVRMRGVMEKCTYCTQRISQARIRSKVENRKIKDGEIKTACQETCPTGAIVFGDINDPQSEVSRWKSSGLDYNLLDELATAPRTTYLAKLTNPNPALETLKALGEDTGAAH